MTANAAFAVTPGLQPRHYDEAAEGYWEAFRQKLSIPLGPEARARNFLRANLNPSHAISAVSASGELLGVAGFKTRAGAFIGGGFGELAAVYGHLGAMWRGALVQILDRQCEPGTLLMDGIFVQSAARGQGVGKRLLGAIEAHAGSLGLKRVRLDVIDANPRARALYEREGFVPVAVQSTGPLKHIFGFAKATTMVKPVG